MKISEFLRRICLHNTRHHYNMLRCMLSDRRRKFRRCFLTQNYNRRNEHFETCFDRWFSTIVVDLIQRWVYSVICLLDMIFSENCLDYRRAITWVSFKRYDCHLMIESSNSIARQIVVEKIVLENIDWIADDFDIDWNMCEFDRNSSDFVVLSYSV